MKIKDLPRLDRPREKIARYGPTKLSTSELLAILLGTGKKDQNVIELARSILQRFSQVNLPALSLGQLLQIKGLGPTKASQIVAALELGRRLFRESPALPLLTAQDIWHSLKEVRNHKKEHLIVFYLDSHQQEIAREIISIGTVEASLFHPREVFEPALRHLASSIIVAHNHPSGQLEPSTEDLVVTKQLIEAGKMLGIPCLDHVILARNGYLSLKEKVWKWHK